MENVFLSFGAGYLNTEIDAPGTTIGGIPIDGNELPMAPAFTLNGVARDTIPTSTLGTFALQADFNYQDDVFFQVVNNGIEFQDGYALLNLRAGWVDPKERISLDVFVENVLDKEYFVFAGNVADQNIGLWGRPITAGIKLSLTY